MTELFVIESLLEEADVCNFAHDIRSLEKSVANGEKIALYAPRNYGKTSIIKNIVANHFQKKHKKSFVFFADLMEVRSMEALEKRLSRYLGESLSHSFSVRNLLEQIKSTIAALRPEIQMDPVSGAPTIQFGFHSEKPRQTLQQIFKTIQKLTQTVPSLLILDEFQDMALVEGAQAEFRAFFQGCGKTPIIVSGSKRHLLSQLLAKPDAPLAFWGKDLELKPIDYAIYQAYMNQRFKPHRISINLENATIIQDLMFRVPEAINQLCLQLIDSHPGKAVTAENIYTSLQTLVEQKQSRYGTYCGTFSEIEERILAAIAQLKNVASPQGKQFLKIVGTSSRTSGLAFKKFMDKGVIEKDAAGYRISDPIFHYFLQRFR